VSLIQLALVEEHVDLKLVVHSDGEKAIQFVAEVNAGRIAHPALVVLDLNLPRVDGRDVLQRIREGEGWRHVPVIVFSSSDSIRDREATVMLGATMYLRKPSNLDEFLKVGKLLKHQLERGSAAAG
jgi:DNA-binding response OmpR family regulator